MTGWLSCNDEPEEDDRARERDRLRKHFNDFAESTNTVGFEWFIGTIRHCTSVYPPGSDFMLRIHRRRPIQTSHGKVKAQCIARSQQGKVKEKQ